MPQDSRVKADQEEIDIFFAFAGANENTDMQEMLEENSTLVYATDEQGDTALYGAISMGREADLETARILMEHGADIQQSRVGRALQFDMDPHIANEMAIITLGVNLNNHSNAVAASSSTLAASQSYNNRYDIKKSDATLKKAAKDGGKGDGKCTIMSVHTITYGEDLQNLYEKISPLNMDEQKKLNQDLYHKFIDHDNAIIDLFDFSPSSFDANQKYDAPTLEDESSISDFSSMFLGAILLLTSIEISYHS